MASAALDHMVSLTIFIAALLIFIGFFSQTMQTGITYQQHNSMSTKTSDLLDTMLLTSGAPAHWGQNDTAPVGFGLQDPDGAQYILSSFAPMRLTSTSQPPVHYTVNNAYYNNLTAGLGSYILTPIDDGNTKSVTYQRASELLGINGTYGFQLTLTPTVTVSLEKTSISGPLHFAIDVSGTGFLLVHANVTSSLIVLDPIAGNYPSFTVYTNNTITDQGGSAKLEFSGIDGESRTYALIVYSYMYGLKGMSYYLHVPSPSSETLVPLVDSFQNHAIRLAHSSTVEGAGYGASTLNYTTSYIIVAEDYGLRQITLEQNPNGTISTGPSDNYKILTLPPNDPGILVVAYKDTSSGQVGVELVPWGLGSLAFPVSFGGNSAGHDWITTDIRQVTVGGIAYQAKLDLWSMQGHGGNNP